MTVLQACFGVEYFLFQGAEGDLIEFRMRQAVGADFHTVMYELLSMVILHTRKGNGVSIALKVTPT